MSTLRRFILPLLLTSLVSIDTQAQHIPNSRSWYLYFGSQDEVRQYVLEVGKGPTVVVLHGGFGAEHSYLLDPLLPLTSKRKLVFYDQRGSLRSPAGQLEVSLPKMVEDLDALRQQLGGRKAGLAQPFHGWCGSDGLPGEVSGQSARPGPDRTSPAGTSIE